MFARIASLMRCPKTHEKLTYNQLSNCYDVETGNISYPIIHGIIDFISTAANESRSSEIIKAYNEISTRYDSLITSSTLFSKFMIYLTWGGLHEEYTGTLTKSIPDDFSGVMVDIPVGTGIYTAEKYSRLRNATIVVVDISLEMLKEAQKRYEEKHINNVVYIHGDVGCLPFADRSADFILSMNGFHSFPNKETAIVEMARILKPNARSAGCFYVSGRRALSDFVVNVSLERANLFAGPFHTADEYIEMFTKHFEFSRVDFCRSFFLYDASKKSTDI